MNKFRKVSDGIWSWNLFVLFKSKIKSMRRTSTAAGTRIILNIANKIVVARIEKIKKIFPYWYFLNFVPILSNGHGKLTTNLRFWILITTLNPSANIWCFSQILSPECKLFAKTFWQDETTASSQTVLLKEDFTFKFLGIPKVSTKFPL